MQKPSRLLRRIAQCAVGGAFAVALFTATGVIPKAQAQATIPPWYPCGSSYGYIPECHFYEQAKAIQEESLHTFQFAVVTGVLNGLQFITQKLAQDTAQWMLSGFTGEGTAFYDTTWEDYLGTLALGAANQVLSSMDTWTTNSPFGFSICSGISLDLKIALGLGKVAGPPAPNCTFAQLAKNYEQTYRGLAPSQIGNTLRNTVQPGGSDMSVGLHSNAKFLDKIIGAKESGLLNRQEGGGLKLMTDLISGRVKTPIEVAKNTMFHSNAVNLQNQQSNVNATVMALGAFWAGFQQLPAMFAATFLNTLAVGLLQKFFDSLNVTDQVIATADVTNPDAQANANPIPTVSISDVLAPNLISSDVQNFVFELSTCPEPRGLWGCSMDNGFVSALQDQTDTGGYTVLRAAGLQPDVPDTGPIFLHPEWELIPESEAKDSQDSGCYLHAYCATNLAKMRFARIISVGWELAANSPFNKKVNGRYVSLDTVIRNFNVCSSDGKLDASHPWCHLIDPTWVLAAPEFQCHIKGFGEEVTPGTPPIRTQECSDVISCLSHDDQGNCTGGFGYCLAEKTVWRFGADSCNEKFVSCRTYTSRDKSIVLDGTNLESTATGPQVSYVRNSIDYGSCSADNVGCMYYSKRLDTSTTTVDLWTGSISNSKAISGSRVYFDATVQNCDAADNGCTKVLAVQPQLSSLNLIENGGFESMAASPPDTLAAWELENGYQFKVFQPPQGDTQQSPQSPEFDGTWNGGITQRVELVPVRNYVLSFSARANEANASHSARIALSLLDSNGVQLPLPQPQKFYRSTNCLQVANSQVSPTAGTTTGIGDTWERYTCEFVTNSDAVKGRITISLKDVVIDEIQLEEGTVATPFVDGDNLALPVDYLKIAPMELACTGNTATDRAECANFARVCRQTEAGCQAYRDVGGADLAEIPASLNARDYCPNSCVGYAEYQKLPSAFDLIKNPAVSYLNDSSDSSTAFFVPKNASQCTAAGAGCEVFTNVEAPSAGGEQKIQLTYARACLKPNDDTRTYFTWEGSDTTGYQLRTWSLIQKTTNAPVNDPLYSVPTTAPRILRKADPSGVVKDPSGCTEDSWKTGEDPDCRQFYDEGGAVYYRYFSQTIVSDPNCRDYRKNDSSLDDCTKTGGDYRQESRECIYHILQSQSNICAAADAGCRGYIGTTGRNAGSVFTESFSTPSSTTFLKGSPVTNTKISTESLLVGDYSLQVGSPNIGVVATEFSSVTNTLYTVSFWMKTTDPGHKTAKIRLNTKEVGNFVTEVDWKRYEIGPFRVTTLNLPNATTSVLAWTDLPNVSYIDQVNIQRLQDIVYVKKDSWVVPPECDQTPEGIPQPQAMLGCREYQDRKSKIVDVRQFSSLCRFETVGCSAYVDTRDSNSAYAESFVMTGLPNPDPNDANAKQWDRLYSGTVTTTRPADRFIYLIDEVSAHCDGANASCRAFGKPIFDVNQGLEAATSTSPFETVYLKDDITRYVDEGGEPKMLCRPSELFCERYVSTPPGGSTITSYYRDPLKHVCEWKDNLLLDATANYPQGTYSGWFVKESEPPTPCYPKKISTGNTFLFEYAGSPGYKGWTSLCPADQSECTEYRDTNDHSDSVHPQGKPYFFIANSKLDKSTCAGKVDLLGGCVLFRDTSDSVLSFSTKASYDKAHAENDNPTPPVDCINDPTNPYCVNVGTCQNVAKKTINPCAANDVICQNFAAAAKVVIDGFYATHPVGTVCSADADCSKSVATTNQNVDNNYKVTGTCQLNDSNLILKVKLSRDCTSWLGCSTGETVYDPQQQTYIDLCEDLAMCDQSLGETGKNFCAHYVDRSATAPVPLLGQGVYEPSMREGAFFDLVDYTSRPTGFGIPDYSSYAMPNHFQIADLVTRKVAYELLVNRPGTKRDSFVHDYRLVASVPLYIGTKQPSGPDKNPGSNYSIDPYGATRYTDTNYSDLNLCVHKQTGRIGYFNTGETPRRCYFAIDSPLSTNVDEVLFGLSSTNPRNAGKMADQFEQLADPTLTQSISQAYPLPECRAYPDSQSPFPNTYVTGWDLSSDPPKPSSYVTGYDGAAYCEYGEDCSCNYRKVSYGGPIKYYSTYGDPPPSGLCIGGTRDGQSCVPGASPPQAGATVASTAPSQSATAVAPTGGSPSEVCGDTGICHSIDTVSLVSGLYANCLQRDLSRTIGGTQLHNPCLMWDPAPVLFGTKDIYHYQPTAGYLPPQDSGEYYCVGPAEPTHDLDVSAYTGVNPLSDDAAALTPEALGEIQWITPPMSTDAFSFDENFVSDGDCFACSGNDGGEDIEDVHFWDGSIAYGGSMGSQCEDADDEENSGNAPGGAGAAVLTAGLSTLFNSGHSEDQMAGRWIQTGRGTTANYVEYVVGFNTKEWTKLVRPGAGNNPDAFEIKQALYERNFAFFNFSPIINPNGRGYLGCGMTTDWVEGVTVDDYDDTDKLTEGQKQWDTYFHANFNGMMTRESQNYLKLTDGTLLKNDCVDQSNASNAPTSDHKCFYKYWQVGYRDEGQIEFIGADSGGMRFDPKSFSVKGLTSASKSFFAIRAMFEDTNPGDNANLPTETSENQLTGPFEFVGWWITASVPGASDERAIYMYLNISSATICPAVAQVISPDTRENAAFTDRVSSASVFSMPLLGFTYSTVNPPFGAAMHTRPIGVEPLFQTHGMIPGLTSSLKPPTFISSGQEFFQYSTAAAYPKGAWGMLTNLFARVYRVYRYYDTAVGSDSNVCIAGPNQGASCDPNADPDACSLVGKCDTGLVDPTKFGGLCNSLSGVNSGLPCGASETDPIAGSAACHNAALQPDKSGNLKPLWSHLGCNLTDNWELNPENSSDWIHCPNGDFSNTANCYHAFKVSDVVSRGGYRCGEDAVTIKGEAAKCDPSVPNFCPVMVIGDGQLDNGKPKIDSKGRVHTGCNSDGRCVGFEQAQCTMDVQCEFTDLEWWGAYNAPRPWGGKFVPDGTGGHYKRDPIFDNPEVDSYASAGVCTGGDPEFNGDVCTRGADCGDPNNDGACTPSDEDAVYWYDPQYSRVSNWFCYGNNNDGFETTNITGNCAPGNLDQDAFMYSYYGADIFTFKNHIDGSDYTDKATAGGSWWQAYSQDAIYGGGGEITYPQGEGDGGVGKDIGGKDLFGGGYLFFPYNTPQHEDRDHDDDASAKTIDDELVGPPAIADRFPGIYAAAIAAHDAGNMDRYADGMLVIPGHCEKLPTKKAVDVTSEVNPRNEDDDGPNSQSVRESVNQDHPYAQVSWFCDDGGTINDPDDPADCDFASADVETEDNQWFEYQRYFVGGPGNQSNAGLPGICVGGSLDGTTCISSDKNACRPADVTDQDIKDAKKYCQPATPDPSWKTDNTPANPPGGPTKKQVYETCFPSSIFQTCDPNQTDLDLDCNLCTHNAGYYPRADLCSNDVSKAQCLTAYKVKGANNNPDLKSVDPSTTATLPPTDVTMGLHLPTFLGASATKFSATDFSYIARYTPTGPMIAAPDTSHACPAAGQCTIAQVNSFSLENQPEGTVAYVGGQAVANIRFYGWAANEQGALKDMWVDWGDNKVQEIHDASMKNHKPFCGVTTECQFVPGLSCASDTDCPPAGGKCVTLGYCSSRAWVSCLKDADCTQGTITTDTCLPRTPFGDSSAACEANYFEFTHAYACGKEMASALPACPTGNTGLCSRDNDRTCNISANTGCAAGDKCLSGLAKSETGGCFDAVKNSCRFTPRVLLKDNWGWCSGECRKVNTGQGLIYGPIGSEAVPHVNGGCYDFSKDVANYDVNNNKNLDDPVINGAAANECNPDNAANTNARPWIVFQGALQLGIAQ